DRCREGEESRDGSDSRHHDHPGHRQLPGCRCAAEEDGRRATRSAASARPTRRRPRGHRAPPRHGRGADPSMKIIEVTRMEARVIGCLIEKQITTPDQYPLSLNALVNACNQKSNRDPMMDVDEPTVQRTLDDLGKKHLILERSGFGSRVPKYQHRFCN